MKFYLGTHHPHWLSRTDVPLFVSRRWLANRKTLPVAQGTWALDSGGFTELSMYGAWQTSPEQYVKEVRRFDDEIGGLRWAAPQDWMCEPFMLQKTGLTVSQHQRRTVDNFLALRESGLPFIPVLQGWELDDYMRCWEMYHHAGVDLEWLPVIGVGSVCRRQNTTEAGNIFRSLAAKLAGIQLHGFGVKVDGLRSFSDVLTSADSMAWSYRARRDFPLPGCAHKSCSNCLRYALRWRNRIEESLGQLTLEAT